MYVVSVSYFKYNNYKCLYCITEAVEYAYAGNSHCTQGVRRKDDVPGCVFTVFPCKRGGIITLITHRNRVLQQVSGNTEFMDYMVLE